MYPLRSVAIPSLILLLFGITGLAQQVTGLDIDKILERADKLLGESKGAYENARAKNSVDAFVDAGFKLEEARIKYLVLQEIGSADKQKIAADRLRTVNQLSKLIHDGKAAIAGTPAESPATKPALPSPVKPAEPPVVPPAADPSSKTVVPPAKAVDVTCRAPIPDPAKQRDAEKLVKELFKEQYSKKTSGDRKTFARLLLEQAAKSEDDPVALWVLCREAQDVALQACDLRTAILAIEAAARVFDVDALSMKNAALAAAGKTAKTPEDYAALAEASQKLIDECVRVDQYDSADKVATLALQNARKSNDSILVSRFMTLAREIAEAKTLFQSMKNVLETLARNPDDPGANLEIGRFLCFVKGTWDLGLRFIVKGSDATLKTLAEKELAVPAQSADRATLADGWYDLAEKEKSPLRKSKLLVHSRVVYESALSEAPALLRAKIEKRLGELDRTSAPGESIDLLALIDPKTDKIFGDWTLQGHTLVSPANVQDTRIQVPYAPPDEYDLRIVAARKTNDSDFTIFLFGGGKLFFVSIDAFDPWIAGLSYIDGKGANVNETTWKGHVFVDDQPRTIVCAVRKTSVTVSVEGKTIIHWKADYKRIGIGTYTGVPNKRALFLDSWAGSFHITQMVLVPVSGQGQKLR